MANLIFIEIHKNLARICKNLLKIREWKCGSRFFDVCLGALICLKLILYKAPDTEKFLSLYTLPGMEECVYSLGSTRLFMNVAGLEAGPIILLMPI